MSTTKEVPPQVEEPEVPVGETSGDKGDAEAGALALSESSESSSSGGCCGWAKFEGNATAQGYNITGIARGCLIMGNIFLATALTYLAAEEAGCVEANEEGEMVVVEDCDEKVFGLFQPASLITNVAVIWGVLTALFMPLTGAILDYTDHRWTVGVGSAVFLAIIQVVQIGVSRKSWPAMCLLMAVSGFLYQIQKLCNQSYLPSVARAVGEEKMTKYISTFTIVQFGSQAIFLMVVVAVSFSLGLRDVDTARASQALNTLIAFASFYFGWRLLPKVPKKHTVPEGKSLWTQGFIQNWETAKKINRQYRKGLRWFLLSVVFGESAANAFTIVSVVFLDEHLGLSASEVGAFFFLALLAMIPGGILCNYITGRTNPKTSLILSMMALSIVGSVGALSLDKDSAFPYSYMWGFAIGMCLGWFYPVENIFLSMVVPASMEAEVSGFFVYCTQILGWLPPLVFSILVENNVERGVAVVSICIFFFLSISILSMSAPWEEILEEVACPEDQTADEIKANKPVLERELTAGVSDTEDSTERSQVVAVNENVPP